MTPLRISLWAALPARLSLSLITLATLGCGRTQPAMDAASVPSAAPDAATPGVAQQAVRVGDFDRQQAIDLPANFPPEARALVPADLPHKLVAFAFERNMALTRPSPGRRKVMLRLATPEPEAAARTAVARHLKTLGWTVDDPTLHSPLQDPQRGRLTVTFEAPPDGPARMELVLEGQEPAGLLENPLRTLHQPLDWLDDAEVEVVGYELGHFHAVRSAGAFTDMQRVAIELRLPTSEARDALLLRLPDRVEQAGYHLEARDSGLYRGEDGGSFVVRPAPDEREVTLHLQQRWTQPKPL